MISLKNHFYGYLIVTNICLKQINEYKKLFAKTVKLNQVDRKKWKLRFRKDHNSMYKLSLYIDNRLEAYWHIISLDQPKLNLDILANINEQSEKLLKEEWFYGVKDKAGLEGMLGQVDNGFFNYNHIQQFFIRLHIFGITFLQNRCLIMEIKGRLY